MANKVYVKRKRRSLMEQKIALLSSYGHHTCDVCIRKRVELIWRSNLKPSELSNSYPVEIHYKLGWRPHVYVSGPNVKRIDSVDFPHIYHRDLEANKVEICLSYGNEFNSTMLLADTIVPWAIEWLYYYEIWLATGEWCGGGIHPTIKHDNGKA